MRICADLSLREWTPDFSSSGQPSPTWTSVRCLGKEICNSLEGPEWTENPVQVLLCDACGIEGCASGGYVHLSRLDGFVLWTAPQIPMDPLDEWTETQYGPAFFLGRLGAIAIPEDTWNGWRSLVDGVPSVSQLPPANGPALADAWRLGPGRPMHVGELLPMLQARLLGCDTLETVDAIERVRRWLERLGDGPIAGTLRRPDAVDARVETLYFDGPAEQDWPAFAVRDDVEFILLDREHAFVPGAADGSRSRP